MSGKDLNKKDDHKITFSDRNIARLIEKERKMFWTVIPIKLLNSERKKYEAGIALVLAGIPREREENVHNGSEWNVFKDLKKIANWLVLQDKSALILVGI